MASTFSPTLRIELIGDGDQSGIWGQTTNTNLGSLIEQAITGVQSITMVDANYTLTSFNGVVDEARNAVLVVGGTNGAVRDVIAPLVEKLYVIRNNTVGGFAINVRGATGSAVSVPNGATVWVYCDGTNFNAINTESVGNFEVNGNLTVTGNTNAVAATYTGNVAALNLSTANVTATGNVSAANFIGAGLTLTSINASNISAGTIANARTTANSANGASTIVARDANGSFAANVGTFVTVSGAYSGNGAGLTDINASNISTGTIANARTTGSSSNGASTIVLRDSNGSFAGNVVTGVTGSFSGNVTAVNFIGAGATITSINASNISSGTIANARTTGSDANGSSTLVLRDANGSFAGNVITATSGSFTNVSGNGIALTAINASNIASGTLATGRLSGSYTGITGVGTLTVGTWNANTIPVAYGGTGVTTSTGTGSVVLSASPTLTGTPNAPTAANGTNTTQIATTAFVNAAVTSATGSLGTMSTQNANNVTITGGSITGITDLAVADGGTGSSTLAANAVLLGNGTSALQTVAPSTSGFALRSNGTTWVSAKLGLGMTGEVWYDVKASRNQGQTYTNSFSYPIMVSVGTPQTFPQHQVDCYVDSVQVAYSGAGNNNYTSTQNASFIVPAGSTYRVDATGAGGIGFWTELY